MNWTQCLKDAGIPELPGRAEVIKQLVEAGAVSKREVWLYQLAKVQEQDERLRQLRAALGFLLAANTAFLLAAAGTAAAVVANHLMVR